MVIVLRIGRLSLFLVMILAAAVVIDGRGSMMMKKREMNTERTAKSSFARRFPIES